MLKTKRLLGELLKSCDIDKTIHKEFDGPLKLCVCKYNQIKGPYKASFNKMHQQLMVRCLKMHWQFIKKEVQYCQDSPSRDNKSAELRLHQLDLNDFLLYKRCQVLVDNINFLYRMHLQKRQTMSLMNL